MRWRYRIYVGGKRDPWCRRVVIWGRATRWRIAISWRRALRWRRGIRWRIYVMWRTATNVVGSCMREVEKPWR